MAFSDDFTFARPGPASYVDAAGVTQIAAQDVPRFDHSGCGRPIGLLVEPGPSLNQGDRVRIVPGAWATLAKATILHEWTDGVSIRAEAHYATDVVAMVNGCLGAAGHHRRIAIMSGFLKNYGGWVWATGQRWSLPRLVGTETGVVIATSSAKPILGS